MVALEFRKLHALVADGKVASAKLLRGVLASLGISNIVMAENSVAALEALKSDDYDVVFCDDQIAPVEPLEFAARLRRSTEGRNRRVPIVLLTDNPRLGFVERARDSGFSDVVVRPFSTNAVKRKLLVLLERPKPFINAEGFVGPDRRRRDRRQDDSEVKPSKERRKAVPRRRNTDKN